MELTSNDASQSKGREVGAQDGGHWVLYGFGDPGGEGGTLQAQSWWPQDGIESLELCFSSLVT